MPGLDREVRSGCVSSQQPAYPSYANQKNRPTVGHKNAIDQILSDTKANHGKQKRKCCHQDNHQSLLPRISKESHSEKVPELLKQRDDRVTGADKREHPRPPGAKTGKKSHKVAKS